MEGIEIMRHFMLNNTAVWPLDTTCMYSISTYRISSSPVGTITKFIHSSYAIMI